MDGCCGTEDIGHKDDVMRSVVHFLGCESNFVKCREYSICKNLGLGQFAPHTRRTYVLAVSVGNGPISPLHARVRQAGTNSKTLRPGAPALAFRTSQRALSTPPRLQTLKGVPRECIDCYCFMYPLHTVNLSQGPTGHASSHKHSISQCREATSRSCLTALARRHRPPNLSISALAQGIVTHVD